jgi:dihydroorotase
VPSGTFDLGIEGGTVVRSDGRARLHVYVADGRVVELTTETRSARERVDASGLLVMPGMVDAHVHLMDPAAQDREDFPTGTAAAAVAGVTTLIEHTHAGPVRDAQELAEKREYLAGRSRIDFALGAHAWPDRLDGIGDLWQAGVAFLKAFTCTTHGVPGFSAAKLLELFRRAAEAHAICLLHCEDESLTEGAEHALRQAGREDGGIVPAWRNREAELSATAVVGLLARETGARVVVAHVSHPAALRLVERERQAGARLAAESCPQYLSLLESEVLEHGAFRKFTPPARARSPADLTVMWEAVAGGLVSYIATDHAPATIEQKQEGSIWDVHFGLPGIDTTLAVLLDGAHAGRISYERVVEVYSTVPARIYGLAPRKGSIAPGADADLVLVDPEHRWTVANEDIISRAGWSPFAGRTLSGRAVRTYVRGALAADERRVVAEPGMGRFVAGPGAYASALS